MDLSITTSATEELTADWLLIPVFDGVDATAIPVPGPTQDAIGCAIKSGDLSGKKGERTTLYVSAPAGVSRVMTVGLGEPDS